MKTKQEEDVTGMDALALATQSDGIRVAPLIMLREMVSCVRWRENNGSGGTR